MIPGDRVILSPSALEDIRRESFARFPEEACGLLVGPRAGNRIERAEPRPNVRAGRRGAHYEIDGLEYVRLEDQLESTGSHVVGFFHSHPGASSEPSRWDRERAWPRFFYVIQALDDVGKAGRLGVFLCTASGRLEPVPFSVEGAATAAPAQGGALRSGSYG